jgi:hypothetical protein
MNEHQESLSRVLGSCWDHNTHASGAATKDAGFSGVFDSQVSVFLAATPKIQRAPVM